MNTEKIWICKSNWNTCQSALQTLCFYKKWDTCMRCTFNVKRLLLTNIAPFLTINTKNVYDLWLNEWICCFLYSTQSKYYLPQINLTWIILSLVDLKLCSQYYLKKIMKVCTFDSLRKKIIHLQQRKFSKLVGV